MLFRIPKQQNKVLFLCVGPLGSGNPALDRFVQR